MEAPLHTPTTKHLSTSWPCELLYWFEAQKHLWLRVYLWVHLRAEPGEQDNFVPPPELVPLPTGHLEHLILNHHPLDENSGREAEGLTQDTVCRRAERAEPTMSV